MEDIFDFKRRHKRKNYQADVVFAHEHRAYNGRLKNLSLGGAFIATRDVNQVSGEDIITITIPYTSGQKHVKRRGVVKWTNNEGFAVEFL